MMVMEGDDVGVLMGVFVVGMEVGTGLGDVVVGGVKFVGVDVGSGLGDVVAIDGDFVGLIVENKMFMVGCMVGDADTVSGASVEESGIIGEEVVDKIVG
mmetsp:Transcript_17777/g.37102  ORF Transcript_17777/g.37102 Transcript_17777/m.37102 type:complete len:99 (+) Transcript_17777:804-1100(+)